MTLIQQIEATNATTSDQKLYKDATYMLTGVISNTSHDNRWSDCFERNENHLHLDTAVCLSRLQCLCLLV